MASDRPQAAPGNPARARARRAGGVAVALVALGVTLSSCGGSQAAALGHTACVDVATSLREFAASRRDATPASARRERAQALDELRRALPPAALAGSGGGAWEALTATLSESSRVPEVDLVDALTAQCAATLGPGG